ncbi:styrene monooxygenase/indole monooxygenase family protein [Amycolatopsis methanolica]|uniref:styrene monooxygenase/indole monooxygenase family protein n=1 Tax=Amycolatopsis methanolica TaxID=1814 RepID=UPI00068911C0|nr:styrene monooxygenase/indole monooxygenase family protein [Amycolatopsis methanolica]
MQARAADDPAFCHAALVLFSRADRPFDELAAGPLLNTVAHHHPLLERERALGVYHWPAAEFGYRAHHHWIGGLRFTGWFTHPSCAVDHRVYLPGLAEDLAARGGHVEVREVGPRDLAALGRRHDLLVVASGRGALSGLFPRRPEHSPHDAPRRLVCAGLYTGIAPAEPAAVTIGVAPGQGELLEIPLLSRHGRVTALLFENVPGGDLAVLNELTRRRTRRCSARRSWRSRTSTTRRRPSACLATSPSPTHATCCRARSRPRCGRTSCRSATTGSPSRSATPTWWWTR